jgi:hypothetical protein
MPGGKENFKVKNVLAQRRKGAKEKQENAIVFPDYPRV